MSSCKKILSCLFFSMALSALCGLFSPAAAAATEDKAEYSADHTIETEDITMKAKIFHAGGQKERSESTMEGQKQIMIFRRDKGLMWNLMPKEKMYMENKLDKGTHGPAGQEDMKMEQTEVGKETLNGIPCTKYKIIATRKDGAKLGGFSWVSNEGVNVKSDLIALEKGKKYRFKIELTNIKMGKQKASLFELPEDYQPMPSFGGMMKGMFGK